MNEEYFKLRLKFLFTGILQFPLVNLNEKDSGATVNFMNPYHHYKELKQASKSDQASFTVTVTLDDVSTNKV